MRTTLPNNFIKKLTGPLLLILLLATGSRLSAADFTATKTGLWTDPTTWGKNANSGQFPKSNGDNVLIGAGKVVTISTGQTGTCKTLKIQGIGAELIVAGTSAVSMDFNVESNGKLTVNGGTANFYKFANIKSGSTFTFSTNGGAANFFSTTEKVTLESGATFTVGTGAVSLLSDLDNSSAITVSAGGSFLYPRIASLTKAGTITLDAGSTFIYSGTAAQSLLNLTYGNLEIRNEVMTNLSQALTSTNLRGNLTLKPNAKLNNKSFNIAAAAGKALTLDAGSELILEGNTTFPSAGFSFRNLNPASTVTYSTNNTSTAIPAETYGNLKISGAAAPSVKTLAGTTTITGTLDLSGKSLAIGSNNLILGPSATITNAAANSYIITGNGKLIMENIGTGGRASVQFPIGTATSYNPAIITNLTSAQSFAANVKDGVSVNGTDFSESLVLKTWDIAPVSAGTPANITLTLQWNSADEVTGFSGADAFRNFDRSSCIISQYDATHSQFATTGAAPSAATGTGPYTLTNDNITTFSPFVVGNGLGPLPAELIAFQAVKKASEVLFTWETASEKNNIGFEIQAATNGKDFESVGFVATRNGNASYRQQYYYTDKTENKEGIIYYRLKQTDLNGTATFYKPIAVNLGNLEGAVTAYPNPFRNQFKIRLQTHSNQVAKIQVTDMAGKTVYAAGQELKKGNNILKIDLADQPAGTYLVKATADNRVITSRLVKQ